MKISLAAKYRHDGFVAPVRIVEPAEAASRRGHLERAEAIVGSLHYRFKVHTILRSAYELATNPLILDLVESILGPNILLYNACFIIKEPQSKSHVSWHQDLTYWGLSSDKQVSVWLALSPATRESGCMQMIPGSHKYGQLDHQTTVDETNVLYHGQTVLGVDEQQAELLELQPGEASFHHGWTLHASLPNRSRDRRIGLNLQFLSTSVRQTQIDRDSALLVRGMDTYKHFEQDIPAGEDLNNAALLRQIQADKQLREIYRKTVN